VVSISLRQLLLPQCKPSQVELELKLTERLRWLAGFQGREFWTSRSRRINSYRWLWPTRTETASSSLPLISCRRCSTATTLRTLWIRTVSPQPTCSTQAVEASLQGISRSLSCTRTRKLHSAYRTNRTSWFFRDTIWDRMVTILLTMESRATNTSMDKPRRTLSTIPLRDQVPRAILSPSTIRDWTMATAASISLRLSSSSMCQEKDSTLCYRTRQTTTIMVVGPIM